jgi:hypothetical protein
MSRESGRFQMTKELSRRLCELRERDGLAGASCDSRPGSLEREQVLV